MKKQVVEIDNDTLAIKSIRDLKFPFWTSLALNFICAVVIALIFLQERSVITIYKNVIVEKVISQSTADMPLTDSALTSELVKCGVMLPNVAVAQAKIESGMGKSNVAKMAKNLFGITYHKCDHVHGKYGMYATYKTFKDNVKCYAHIQRRYLGNIYLKYSSEPTYADKLKEMR